MKTANESTKAALRAIGERLESGRLSKQEIDKRTAAFLRSVKEFNSNWDRDLEFFVDQVEDWMDEIPAIWFKPLPFPHPAYSHGADEDWRSFLAEQRKVSGQEAAYLTNGIREENSFLRQIVVSRAWLWVALTGGVKLGSDEFWELVVDEVVRELPDWTVDDGGDQLSPDIKTLRNMISVRKHKRFLRKIVGLNISQDG